MRSIAQAVRHGHEQNLRSGVRLYRLDFGDFLSRDDLARVDGVIVGILGGGSYSVDLRNGARIIARRSGKLRKFHIKVMPGDAVTVGVSPYDVSHGLIVTRR